MKIWKQLDDEEWKFFLEDTYCGWVIETAEGWVFNHRNPEDLNGVWLYPYGRPGHLARTCGEAMDKVEQFYRENLLPTY